MAKFKCEEKVIIISSGEEVKIKKVIQDFGAKSVKYELYSGQKVNESELLKLKDAEKVSKILHTSTKKGKKTIEKLSYGITKNTGKTKSVSVVEKSDEVINNQEVEKSDFSKENS